MGANHFNKISIRMFKNIIVDFLFGLSNTSQYKASFGYDKFRKGFNKNRKFNN